MADASFMPEVKSTRCRHATALQLELLKKKGVHDAVVMQVDQLGNRMPAGVGVVPCLVTHGAYYLTDPPRMLFARDHLTLQGLSAEEQSALGLDSLDSTLQRTLAGNALNGPVATVALLALLGIA